MYNDYTFEIENPSTGAIVQFTLVADSAHSARSIVFNMMDAIMQSAKPSFVQVTPIG